MPPSDDPTSPIDSAQRPLSARSVILSVLLGTRPPRLPPRRLVRATALFDISDGATRTALSRLAERGELVIGDDGWYELSAEHRTRQDRQDRSVAGEQVVWSGRWRMALVTEGARTASERAKLRHELLGARFAELREGVWLRPDNIERSATPVADQQCRWFDTAPAANDEQLAGELWDLGGWSAHAELLRRRLDAAGRALSPVHPVALREGFEVAADVLRHLQHDPMLPPELLSRRWPGARLRAEFAEFDRSYRAALLGWLAGGDLG